MDGFRDSGDERICIVEVMGLRSVPGGERTSYCVEFVWFSTETFENEDHALLPLCCNPSKARERELKILQLMFIYLLNLVMKRKL